MESFVWRILIMHNTRQMPLRLVSGTERSVLRHRNSTQGNHWTAGRTCTRSVRCSTLWAVGMRREVFQNTGMNRNTGCLTGSSAGVWKRRKKRVTRVRMNCRKRCRSCKINWRNRQQNLESLFLPGRQRGSEQPMRLSECLIFWPGMGVRLYIRKLMIRLRFAHLRKIWESKRTGPAYIESDAEASGLIMAKLWSCHIFIFQ